jgi:hypothetical protein
MPIKESKSKYLAAKAHVHVDTSLPGCKPDVVVSFIIIVVFVVSYTFGDPLLQRDRKRSFNNLHLHYQLSSKISIWGNPR